MNQLYLHSIYILLAVYTAAVGQEAAPPGRDSLAIAAAAGNQQLLLSRRYLLMGSDSLWLNGRWLERDQQYAIDYANSSVLLATPLAAADTLVAVFWTVPLPIAKPAQYLPLVPADSLQADSAGYVDSVRTPSPSGTAAPGSLNQGEVRLGGSKSLGVSVGSGRDMTVEQALQVSINGRLARNLEVNAYLSDQEMPLSTSGSTQELSQLDRVFIQARAPQWEVVLGDHDLKSQGLEFMTLNRQVEGVQATGRLAGRTVTVSTATSQGKAAVARFDGQEGIQGPYQLSGPDGAAGFTVLAGSEQVWLDGQLLRRGSAEDYTIDYERAQVSFTPKRLVTPESKIIIQFQYSLQEFRRNLSSAQAELPVAGPLALRFGYFQEADDRDRPMLQQLDEVQQQQLSLAGDDTAKLWMDGGVKVDSGQGDYLKQDSIYVYAGAGAGDHQVGFTWVGHGRGDYEYRPIDGYYVYIGYGLGGYRARRRLPRPGRQAAVAAGGRLSWAGGGLDLEGAVSENDRNLLSSIDDGDNRGRAWGYGLAWSRDSLGWGGFSLKSSGRFQQSNFWTGITREQPGFESRWNLQSWRGLRPIDPQSGQRWYDNSFSVRPGRLVSLGGGWGRMAFGDSLVARKYDGWTKVQPAQGLSIAYAHQQSLLDGPWFTAAAERGWRRSNQLQNEYAFSRYRIQAGFNISDDMQYDTDGVGSGHRIEEYWSGAARQFQTGTVNSTLKRQEELARDSSQASWVGESYTTTWQNTVDLKPTQNLSLGLEHSLRKKVLRPNAVGQGAWVHLGMLRLSLSPWKRALVAGLDYSLSSSQSQQKREQYVRVPAGTGDYSYDPGTGAFYPDTAGSYLRQVSDEGPPARTADVSLRTSVSFDPSLKFAPSWWTKARCGLSAQSAIRSLRPVSPKLAGFAPSRLWDSQGNVTSNLDMAGDVWYAGGRLSHHLRYRWRRDDDNQYLNRHTIQRQIERWWESYFDITEAARIKARAEYGLTSTQSREYGLESRSRPLRFEGEVSWRPRRVLEISPKLATAREQVERAYSGTLATAILFREYSGELAATSFTGMAGSLRLGLGSLHRRADRAMADIPMEYQFTRPLGWTWQWHGQYDYHLNRNLMITSGYDGRREPGRKASHTGRMEVRAYF